MSRRTRAVLGSVVALLAVAGCATSTAGSGRPADGATAAGGPAASPTSPPPTGGADPTASGPAGSALPGDPTGRVASVGTLRMPLTPGTTARVDGDFLCVTLANGTGCDLEVVDIGRIRAAGGSVSTPAPGEEYGWWWGSDAPSCGDSGQVSAVTRSAVTEKGFKKVGPKTAAYGRWAVSCADATKDFAPRLWWLPTSQLALRQRGSAAGTGEAVDKLLAGVTFGA
ncbi:MAG: hypothetical protein AVDCRST_MAG41-3936 [uncultured Corynebacteriales bacterium]|uniref:Uncharacterized protein n=1 Tax=uncultured Mycobacteriales bacterium TaxID=581187 RepID=A0A6J4JR29_9ACTN|nr:MAG: hypothetical protein AVDCRST_MAG41-3936 [uncultured Corynebacteriales bacterium]